MTTFLTALALAVVIEGLLYAAFPEQMKRVLASLMAMPAPQIRAGALMCAGLGLAMLWLVTGVSA